MRPPVAPSTEELGECLARIGRAHERLANEERVDSCAAQASDITRRVNAAFGYRAISEVVFVQTLPPPRSGSPVGSGHPASPEQRAKATWALDAKLEKVKSPELRASQRRLGSDD